MFPAKTLGRKPSREIHPLESWTRAHRSNFANKATLPRMNAAKLFRE